MSVAIASATLPPAFFSTDHRQRCLVQLGTKTTGLEKYIYLSALKDRDPSLFYEVLLENMLVLPILRFTMSLLTSRTTLGNNSYPIYANRAAVFHMYLIRQIITLNPRLVMLVQIIRTFGAAPKACTFLSNTKAASARSCRLIRHNWILVLPSSPMVRRLVSLQSSLRCSTLC
jgi:hypothetical protein